MRALAKTDVPEAIRRRYMEGAIVGGTSAGAAVMSQVMIAGKSDLGSLTAGDTPTYTGLGLWPDVIVDQHFLKRGRFSRLTTAVLDRPKLIGVGIDESTAVVVTGRTFEVIGRSNVVVVDARKATMTHAKNGEPAAGANLTMHVLRAGMRFDLDRGVVAGP
jgi:cyanophycinase